MSCHAFTSSTAPSPPRTNLARTRDNIRDQPATEHEKQRSQDRPVRRAARIRRVRRRVGQVARRRTRLPFERPQVRRAAARGRRHPVGADARRSEFGERIPHEPSADRLRLRRLRRAWLPGERPDLPAGRWHADRQLGVWRRGTRHEECRRTGRAQGWQRRDRQAGVPVPDRDRVLGLSASQGKRRKLAAPVSLARSAPRYAPV
ncbi:hypothetical protein EMIT0158MI4_130097 [Burkholderia ambifaria]